jgi:two-component system, OmpR family, response regulator
MATPIGTGVGGPVVAVVPPTDAAGPEVALLPWPVGEAERAQLAGSRTPRVLLVALDAAPPRCVDPLEDWVREPIDLDELEIRAATVARRAREPDHRPSVDSAGRVWRSGRSVEVPPAQVPVARLLVSRFGRVVPAAEIRASYLGAGGSSHPKALKAMIGRVKQRLACLGLRLVNVRDRGYLLEPGPESRQS